MLLMSGMSGMDVLRDDLELCCVQCVVACSVAACAFVGEVHEREFVLSFKDCGLLVGPIRANASRWKAPPAPTYWTQGPNNSGSTSGGSLAQEV